MPNRDCLSEDDVAELVEGRLPPEEETHLDECAECRRLVGAVSAETRGEASALPRRIETPSVLPRDARVGRYVILEVVGSGAMGRVYAAYDPELDRKVALKLLHASVADPQLEARLRREAKAMARASHTEMITVYDAGLHGAQLARGVLHRGRGRVERVDVLLTTLHAAARRRRPSRRA